MEKENNNKLMLRFSRIFTSSCKTQDISKVIDHKNPIFTPLTPLMESEEREYKYNPVTKPKQPPPLICKPRCPDSFDLMVRENCIIATPSPRRKITGRYSLLSPAGDFSGRRCPPVSPVSPLTQKTTKKTHKNKEKKKIEKTHLPNNHPFNFSSSNETDFFSSDDEREEEDDENTKTEHTLFSSLKSVSFSSKSVSLSSDSDDPDPPNPGRVRNHRRRRRRRAAPAAEKVVVKDSFAVVKSSRDPYSDFRTSMVEMIMEKQIFGSKELEDLVRCFLSLNSQHHHRVILEVFTEICDALFSNCS